MILIVSIVAVSSLSLLLAALVFPALVGNHFVHALGLHKVWPDMFEHSYLLEEQRREGEE